MTDRITGGFSEANAVDFYIDINGNEIAPTENAPANVATGVRYTSGLGFSQITTPNGDTLDNYQNIQVEGQVYKNSIWGFMGFVNISGGYGVQANIADENQIVVQCGKNGLAADSNNIGGVHGAAGVAASLPFRCRITGVKVV